MRQRKPWVHRRKACVVVLAGVALACGCAGPARKGPKCDAADTTGEFAAMTGLAWLPRGYVFGVESAGGMTNYSAADFAVDDDEQTYWRGGSGPDGHPALVVGLDTTRLVKELRYRAAAGEPGLAEYAVYVSTDGQCWGDAVGKGALGAGEEQIALRPKAGRYVRLVMASAVNGGDEVAVAELAVGVGAGFVSEAPTYALEGDPYRYEVKVDMAAEEPPVFELVEGPEGVSVEPSTGTVSWTPVSGQAGPHSIGVRARAGQSAAEQTFVVEVLKAEEVGAGQVSAASGGRVTIEGTGTFFDGAALEFAPGALRQDETIRLVRVTGNTPALWREHALVGDWFAIRPAFDEPVDVAITLKVRPQDLPSWASLEHISLVQQGEGFAGHAAPGPQVPFPVGQTAIVAGDQAVQADMAVLGRLRFAAVASYWAQQTRGGFEVWWACDPPAVCGSGTCDVGEDCANCPADCCRSCGDQSCGAGECTSCPGDCGAELDGERCVVAPSCGDMTCNGTEDCSKCSIDCGQCSCGDGACSPGECSACPGDCPDCNLQTDACEALKPRVDQLMAQLEEIAGLYRASGCEVPPLARVYVGTFSSDLVSSEGYGGSAYRRRLLLPTTLLELPYARVAIAHEYFHSIQDAYTADQKADTWPNEATAVLMEDVIYDDDDWYVSARAPWGLERTTLPIGGVGSDGYKKMMFLRHLATVADFDACEFYKQFAPKLSKPAGAADEDRRQTHRSTIDALTDYLTGKRHKLAERWLSFASEYNVFRRDAQIEEISKLTFEFSTVPADFVVCEDAAKFFRSQVAGAYSVGIEFVPKPGARPGRPGASIVVTAQPVGASESMEASPVAVPNYEFAVYSSDGQVVQQESGPANGAPLVIDLPEVTLNQPYFLTYANTDYLDETVHDVTITVVDAARTTIEGTVTDQSGAPVKATVTATPSRGKTCGIQRPNSVNSDATGAYRLQIVMEEAGPVELVATCANAPGNPTAVVDVKPGDTVRQDLQVAGNCSFVCTSLGAGYVACPTSGECIHKSAFCDGTPDCPGGADEMTCSDGTTPCGGSCP
jgi:hypothetical protein